MKRHPKLWYVFATIPVLLIVFIFQVYEIDRKAIGWISLCTLSFLTALRLANRTQKYQSKLKSDEYAGERAWLEENVRPGSLLDDVKRMIETRFRLRVSDRAYSKKHGASRCHDYESEITDLRILEKDGKVVEVKIDASY